MKTRKMNLQMMISVIIVLSGVILGISSAFAQQSPLGCNANCLDVTIGRSAGETANGGTVGFTVGVTNSVTCGAGNGCDVDQMTLTFRCPDSQGNIPPTTPSVVLLTNGVFPVDGSGNITYSYVDIPELNCLIDADPGVSFVFAYAIGGDQTGTLDNLLEGRLRSSTSGSPFRKNPTIDITILSCEVEVDKQVSCDGGLTWTDPGLVKANEDGTFSCNGQNGSDILVQYQASNVGEADVFSCTISESNSGIGSGANVGNLISGATTDFILDDDQVCSDDLEAGEPDTATLTCYCTEDLNPDFTASAFDIADFACLNCKVEVDKQVSCNNGDTWTDPGLVEMNEDGTFSCDGVTGATILVRYAAKNVGEVPVYDCGLTESNTAITTDPVTIGDLAVDAEVLLDPINAICDATLEAGEPNTATLECLCEDNSQTTLTASAYDIANINCETCEVKIDKEVSCDGGMTWYDDNGLVTNNEDGTELGCAGIDGQEIQVRYVVSNTGNTNLYSCVLTESNSLIRNTTLTVGNIVLGGSYNSPVDDNQLCSDALEAGEPDTAGVSCFCTSDLNEELKTAALDTATFTCGTPGLTVDKICDPQEGNTNDVTITVTNTGDVDLTNCVVTDMIYLDDSECPANVGSGTAVTVSPTPFDLDAEGSQTVTGSVEGLTADACNTVSVTCDIVGTSETITVDADDVCEAGQGCLTRTPGFWATHPDITDNYLPLWSCGLEIDSVLANDPNSATEDMCSIGTDNKASNYPSATSPQQVQLIRQCMAANLNIAATIEGGGSCESEYPFLSELMGVCCNGIVDDGDSFAGVCNGGYSPSSGLLNVCIWYLDAFNNSDDTLVFDPFIKPGKANPSNCKDSKNNKWMNPGRNLGPAK